MKKITAYQASDLSLFANEKDCASHEAMLKYRSWYNDDVGNKLYAATCPDVVWDELVSWLKAHKYVVKEILQL